MSFPSFIQRYLGGFRHGLFDEPGDSSRPVSSPEIAYRNKTANGGIYGGEGQDTLASADYTGADDYIGADVGQWLGRQARGELDTFVSGDMSAAPGYVQPMQPLGYTPPPSAGPGGSPLPNAGRIQQSMHPDWMERLMRNARVRGGY